jgi:hypothetical protein
MTQKQLLQGAGDGTAVPAGFIGEKLEATITSTFTQASPVAQTIYDVTGLSISVTPGVWVMSAFGVVQVSCANTSVTGVLYLRDSANNNIQFATGSQGHPTTQFTQTSALYISETIVVSSTTTYKVSAANRKTTGTAQTTPTLAVAVGADYAVNAYIRAVRIA